MTPRQTDAERGAPVDLGIDLDGAAVALDHLPRARGAEDEPRAAAQPPGEDDRDQGGGEPHQDRRDHRDVRRVGPLGGLRLLGARCVGGRLRRGCAA